MLSVSRDLKSILYKSYLSDCVAQWEATHCEDLADLNDDKTEQKQLHFPARIILSVDISMANKDIPYLRPTAACFLSDLHIIPAVKTMAMKASRIDPIRNQPSCSYHLSPNHIGFGFGFVDRT